MSELPIITGEEIRPAPLPVQLYISVFRWDDKLFLDLETQEKVTGKFWKFVCNNPTFAYRNGRRVYGESKTYRVRTVNGRIIEKTSKESKGKVFGYQALADALSTRFPITSYEVQELIKPAIANNSNHMKFVLKSDLIPTSPERFEGKNEWLLIANYPSTDQINRKINKFLKSAGSPLRIESALRHKMIEV